jgi:hypothetical protein
VGPSLLTAYTSNNDKGTTTRAAVPKNPQPSTKETKHDPRKKKHLTLT